MFKYFSDGVAVYRFNESHGPVFVSSLETFLSTQSEGYQPWVDFNRECEAPPARHMVGEPVKIGGDDYGLIINRAYIVPKGKEAHGLYAVTIPYLSMTQIVPDAFLERAPKEVVEYALAQLDYTQLKSMALEGYTYFTCTGLATRVYETARAYLRTIQEAARD